MRRPSLWRSGALLGLSAVAGYGHLLYPAYIWFTTRGRKPAARPAIPDLPGMTVLVPAYREQAVIAQKIDQLLSIEYRGPREIIVVADDPETAAAARRPEVKIISRAQRNGKPSAVNDGFHAATQPIVVLTDANAWIEPSSWAALAAHFADPTVGAVAGEKRVADEVGGQGFYWKFESWLKRRESLTGTTTAVVGELLAVRREAFQPLPTDTSVDDTWLAVDLARRGWRIVYEPDAFSVEAAPESFAQEWERRTRVVAGNLDMLWRQRGALLPGRTDATAQLWGHRLVRSSFGPLAHLVLVGAALASVRRSWLARLTIVGHLFAMIGLLRSARGKPSPTLLRLPGQVLFLQLVGLGGVRRYIFSARSGIWPKPERSDSELLSAKTEVVLDAAPDGASAQNHLLVETQQEIVLTESDAR